MAQKGDQFIGSKKNGTLGVELECIYVRPDTMIPIGVGDDTLTGDDIIKWINDQGRVEADREWRKDTVEVRPHSSQVCWDDTAQAKVGIFDLYDSLVKAADHFGVIAVPVAHYPGQRADIYQNDAYSKIYRRYPSVRDGANFLGLHIHYGITNLNGAAMRALRRLNSVSGFMVGLFANSPCFKNDWASRRMMRFVIIPGVTFFNWDSVAQYEDFMTECLNEGIIEQRSRLWSINRPSIYTLEVRCLDMLGSIREAWTAVGMYQALIRRFLANHDTNFKEFGYMKCNRGRELGAGYGLRDQSQTAWNPWRGGQETTIADIYQDLRAYIDADMEELGWLDELRHFEHMVDARDNGAERISRWWSQGLNPMAESFKCLKNELKRLEPEVETLREQIRKAKIGVAAC